MCWLLPMITAVYFPFPMWITLQACLVSFSIFFIARVACVSVILFSFVLFFGLRCACLTLSLYALFCLMQYVKQKILRLFSESHFPYKRFRSFTQCKKQIDT